MFDSIFDSIEDIYDNVRGKRKKRRSTRKAKRSSRKAKRQVKKSTRKSTRKVKQTVRRKKVKGVAKKVVKRAKKTIGKAALLPLKPFMKVIKKVLSKKGVNTRGISNEKAVELFYNKVVIKKSFEGYRDLQSLEEDSFAQHPSFSTDIEYADEQDHIAGAAVGVVVDAVISYFKDKKNKKEKGQTLTKDENLIAETAKRVEKELLEKQKGARPVTQDDNDKLKKMIITSIGIVIVGLGAYLFFKKK